VNIIHLPATFIGNLLFLQTVAVPTFGSNTPLWSLARISHKSQVHRGSD
jgi:ribosome recycling factor